MTREEFIENYTKSMNLVVFGNQTPILELFKP